MEMQFHKAVVKVLVIVSTDRTKTPVSLTFEDARSIRLTESAADAEPLPQKLVEQVSVTQLWLAESRPISLRTKISGLLKQKIFMYRRNAIEIPFPQ